MATYKAGTGGKVTIGTTDLTVGQWNVAIDVDYEDTTNSGSDTLANNTNVVAKEQIPIAGQLSADFEAVFDSDAPPWDDPPNLQAGEQVAIKLYVGNTSTYWYAAKFDVKHAEITNVIGGKITWKVSGVSNGAWACPA